MGKLAGKMEPAVFPGEREAPMRTEHYIALDVHCAFTELAVVTKGGRLTQRERCPTAIPNRPNETRSVGARWSSLGWHRPRCFREFHGVNEPTVP